MYQNINVKNILIYLDARVLFILILELLWEKNPSGKPLAITTSISQSWKAHISLWGGGGSSKTSRNLSRGSPIQ